MKIWAIIPMKALAKAKTRLAPVLTLEERRQLVVQLFEHTLQELAGWPILEGVLVVSVDPFFSEITQTFGYEFLREEQPSGLNASVTLAAQHLQARGAQAVLVIHGDLPWISQNELDSLVKAAPDKGILIAPDRHYSGTNILWASPPLAIPFAYGCDSFQKHQELALKANYPVIIFKSEKLSVDLDLPEDLIIYENYLPNTPGGEK
ncbi:MAG: 2-phospho-L-lactate guanylyltransferase [Chloroflexi bacterium HGW-Chloroflexi-10]|nr:MAG: 2-phospho-L-lactate guanylyltransferase [Chloroflexi bacterium HGW-Chloroflexi-10]